MAADLIGAVGAVDGVRKHGRLGVAAEGAPSAVAGGPVVRLGRVAYSPRGREVWLSGGGGRWLGRAAGEEDELAVGPGDGHLLQDKPAD